MVGERAPGGSPLGTDTSILPTVPAWAQLSARSGWLERSANWSSSFFWSSDRYRSLW